MVPDGCTNKGNHQTAKYEDLSLITMYPSPSGGALRAQPLSADPTLIQNFTHQASLLNLRPAPLHIRT